MHTDNISLCVALILFSRHAQARNDENACDVYGDAMKHFIRTRGLTVKDCDRAMRIVQSTYHSKPTIKMAAVIVDVSDIGT